MKQQLTASFNDFAASLGDLLVDPAQRRSGA
jgi:hypothetical protein